MWIGLKKGHSRTWSKQEMVEISATLIKCNSTRPSEIHRSIRALDQISHWKGTEFRTFLLYIGIVLLKSHLSEREYEMFINLYCAVTLCSSKVYHRYLPLARNLFIDFIENHIEIHGESSITMNIHNTSHVVDDVEIFGPLDTISAYEFENSLHHIKLRLKQCNRPLQQIARRLSELAASTGTTTWKPTPFVPKCNHQFKVRGHSLAYKQVEFKQNAILSNNDKCGKDKWFMTCANVIVEFHFIFKKDEKYIIRGAVLKEKQNFFEKPFDSKHLNIYMSDSELNDRCSNIDVQYFELNDIKAKMFCIPYEKKWVFVPLLHTFD